MVRITITVDFWNVLEDVEQMFNLRERVDVNLCLILLETVLQRIEFLIFCHDSWLHDEEF